MKIGFFVLKCGFNLLFDMAKSQAAFVTVYEAWKNLYFSKYFYAHQMQKVQFQLVPISINC